MRLHTTSRLLLGGGLAIGAIGSVGLLVGVDPVPTAGWLVDVAIYKLAFIASGGLLLAGGVAGRWANRARLAPKSGAGALAASSTAPDHTPESMLGAARGRSASNSRTTRPSSDDRA